MPFRRLKLQGIKGDQKSVFFRLLRTENTILGMVHQDVFSLEDPKPHRRKAAGVADRPIDRRITVY
jgi:hypothetical protein